MEHYQGFDPIIIMKVRNICCKVYQKKLKKELSKLDGVYSVDINPENGLVSIKGKLDTEALLKTVSKTGKSAEIISPNKNPTNAKDHKTCWCQETNKCRKQEEEEHKCEDYVPPLIDERICRDYYCKSHRMRPMFRDHVPGIEYPRFYGRFSHHAGGDRYGPRWFAEEPPWGAYGFRSGRRLSGFDDYSYLGYGDATRCHIM